MDMKKILCKEIIDKVAAIKRQGRKNYSNYLPLIGHDNEEKFDGMVGEHTVLFLTKENIVHRVVFFSSDRTELISMLADCPKGLGLDVAAKTQEIQDDFILEAGFQKAAVLQKLVFPDTIMTDEEINANETLRNMYADRNDSIIEYAEDSDVSEISTILHETFNEYIDHLPTEDELLKEFIRKRGMLLYREDNSIKALVGFIINGSRMFWMYAINNSGDYKVMNALVVKSREIALEKKIKHVHGFLDLSEKRKRAAKYYDRRGTERAEFYNHIYVNCDVNEGR